MSTFWLKIQLVDDAIFSDSMRTTGGHTTLPYITGAAILGAAASRLYGRKGIDNYQYFHSGNIRFGNGYPICGDQVALPMPLSLQYPKSNPPSYDSDHPGHLQAGDLVNTAMQPLKVDVQYKAIRKGFLSASGQHYKTATREDTKSATGGARMVERSQLFSYQSITAGQCFISEIIAQDDAQAECLKKALAGTLHLGRSRSAQFAKSHTTVLTQAPQGFACNPEPSQQIVIWAVSDLCLTDDYGQPLLTPTGASLFGQHGASMTYVADKSSLRFRSYAPYNGKRRHYDMERQLISAGSVLVFESEEKVNPTLLPNMVGLHQEHGLGRLLINSEMLTNATLSFSQLQPCTEAAVTNPLDKTLQATLQSHAEFRSLSHQLNEEVDKALIDLSKAYASNDRAQLPSASQWGRVYQGALNSADIKEFIGQLGHESWQQKINSSDQVSRYLLKFSGSNLPHAMQRLRTRKLAHRAMALAKQGDQS
jgi:hypothetical protein